MKYLLICMIALVNLFIGCATTHPGNEGKSTAKEPIIPLKISAQTIDDARGESFQLIELTLENTSENWLRIARSQIVISNPAESKLSVVLGKDLRDWAQAMELRLKKDEHNRQLLQVGLVTAGAAAVVAGTHNNDSSVATVGMATLVGTSAWAVTDVIRQSYRTAQQVDKIPENHLYQAFSVPGKMFLRRWILLNKPSNSLVTTLVIALETVEGEKEHYEIKL